MSKTSASEFALLHECDESWVSNMHDQLVPVFKQDQTGRYQGRDIVVLKHDRNAMWMVRFIDGQTKIVNGEDIDCSQ